MLRFSKVRDVKDPVRGTEQSAGIDFFVPNDLELIKVYPGCQINIPSGIHLDLIGSGLEDYALIFFNKSGIATKRDLQVGACVVDADYQGEVHLNVMNVGKQIRIIMPGDKIVQGILLPVEYDMTEEIPFADLYDRTTQRGDGGFGSTGEK